MSDLRYLEIIVFPRPHHSSLYILLSILAILTILAILAILTILATLAMLTPVEELLCEGKVLNGDGWIVAHVVADHLRFKDDENIGLSENGR